MRLRRSRPIPVVADSAFMGFRFQPEIIVLAVRWYLRYGLSYRDVEELLGERGIEVDHVTIYRWAQGFTPLLADAAVPCRHTVGDRWFVDEFVFVDVQLVEGFAEAAIERQGYGKASSHKIGPLRLAADGVTCVEYRLVTVGGFAIAAEVEEHTAGDGFLAVFDGPARAISCAQMIIDGTATLGLAIRAGVHTGEIELRGDDIASIGVNIGARVVALASENEILVSRTVVDLVAGSPIRFVDRGEHELKGIDTPWRLYAVERQPAS